MNKLVKFEKREIVNGFTVHEGWWGEFSPTGELVKCYAYPRVEINKYDWSYSWKQCEIFYPFDGGFVGDLERLEKLPDLVVADFCDVAEQEMLDQKDKFLEYYGE